jgi:hypothetical protein
MRSTGEAMNPMNTPRPLILVCGEGVNVGMVLGPIVYAHPSCVPWSGSTGCDWTQLGESEARRHDRASLATVCAFCGLR